MAKAQNRQPNAPELSIVIPAYAEERRIGRSLEQLADFLKRDAFFKTKLVEVLVVAADAPDKTKKIVSQKSRLFKNLRLLEPGPRRGKGRDVRHGVAQASGQKIIFMDADLATPLRHLAKFYRACGENDLVVGTRDLLKYRRSKLRRGVSYGGNILFRLAGGVWIEDSQCGFKMFGQDAAKLCFERLRIEGWGFDMELLAIAKSNGLKIKAFRISDWRDMPHSTYDASLGRTVFVSLGDLSKVAGRRLAGRYRS